MNAPAVSKKIDPLRHQHFDEAHYSLYQALHGIATYYRA